VGVGIVFSHEGEGEGDEVLSVKQFVKCAPPPPSPLTSLPFPPLFSVGDVAIASSILKSQFHVADRCCCVACFGCWFSVVFS
jgi:hypothetical protein